MSVNVAQLIVFLQSLPQDAVVNVVEVESKYNATYGVEREIDGLDNDGNLYYNDENNTLLFGQTR